MGIVLRGYLKEDGSTKEIEVEELVPSAPVDTLEDIHYIGDTDEPVFENGWHNFTSLPFEPAGFYKDRDRVFLSGHVDGGVASNAAFTLPVDYRPAVSITFWGNDTDYTWLINGSGIVVPKLRNSPYGWSLNGLSFRVA